MGTINIILLPGSPPPNFLLFFQHPVSHLFLSFSPSFFFTFSTMHPPTPQTGRKGQSFPHRGPHVRYCPYGHLGYVSARQPGAAGTLGSTEALPGETLNVSSCHWTPVPPLVTSSLILFILCCFFPPVLVHIQSSLQSNPRGRGRSRWIADGCQGL